MKTIAAAILFLLAQQGFGQAGLSIDSLEKHLAAAKSDTARVSLLINIGSQYILSDPKTSERYYLDGLALSQRINYKKGEADCLRLSGNIYKRQGQYSRALNNILKALSISESISDSLAISAAFGHIGDIYGEQGDYQKARQYYFKAKKIDELIHKNPALMLMLLNVAKSYQRQGIPDSAIVYLDQCYTLAMKTNNDLMMDGILTTRGELEASAGNNDVAIANFRRSIPYSAAKNAHANLSDTYYGIASLYKRLALNDSCIFYGQKSLASAQRVNYVKGIMASSQLLSDAFEGINKDEVLKYYRIAMTAKDSLFNAEKVRQFQNLSFAEQQRLESLEDAKIEYRNKIQLYTLLLFGAAFLAIAIILYINNRNKHKANLILQQQKDEVQRTLTELKVMQAQLIHAEKMASLGELTAGIAHEIQNPLNFVNNFSEVSTDLLNEMNEELKKGNFEEVKAITEDIIKNLEKILHHGRRADGIVKGMLQHSRSSSGAKEPTDINGLADEYLRLAYHGFRAKDKSFNVTTKTDFDESVGKANVGPQEIGRVILNLITNAFYTVSEKKKKSGDEYEPTVTLRTKRNADHLLVSVVDNGEGIPQKVLDKIFQPFFTTKPAGQGTGLGLSISYDIVNAHGGELKVQTSIGKGSEFIIELPG